MSTIVVLGSSGYIGTAVVKALAEKHGSVSILAGVREPSSEKAKALLAFGRNVSVFKFDFSNPETADNIPRSATSVFINTPGDENRTALTIAGIEAAKKAQAKHIVLISFPTVAVPDLALFGRQIKPVEDHIARVGIPYTILRLPLFIENNWANLDSIKSQAKLYGPLQPTALYSSISTADVGLAAAIVLTSSSKHNKKTYTLTTKPYNSLDLAKAFSTATGKTIEYVQVPYEAAKQAFVKLGTPEWQAEGVMELFHLIDNKNPAALTWGDDFRVLTSQAPKTIEEWTAQVGSAFQ